MPDFLELERVHFPLLGNSIAVGVAALLHIAFAALAVGFMMVTPIAEAIGRSRPWYTEAAHTMTRFTLVTYTASLVLAVIMVDLFVGLFPITNAWLFNQFRSAIVIAVIAFFAQLFTLYPYYHFWDQLRAWSVRGHIWLGAMAAVFMIVWVAVLDGIGSYMLTPVEGEGQWSLLTNPTWVPLALHRFVGNFVIAGYAIAGYAAWRLGRARAEDETYYVTVLKAGFLFGLGALLLQPVFGLLYATMIQRAVPAAYEQLIQGPYRIMVVVQFTLIGLLFLGSQLWLSAVQRGRAFPRWTLMLSGVAVIGMIASVGQPTIRRAFTFLLVALTLWAAYHVRRTLLGAQVQEAAATLRRPVIRAVSIALSVVSLLTYLTMGTIRETARRPDTVRGVISLADEASTPAAFRQGRLPQQPSQRER